jgi:hypothetical protein
VKCRPEVPEQIGQSRVVGPRDPAVAAPAAVGLVGLFLGFLEMSLSRFGAALGWARRIVAERRRWLTERELAALLGLCQALPGGGESVVVAIPEQGAREHQQPRVVASSPVAADQDGPTFGYPRQRPLDYPVRAQYCSRRDGRSSRMSAMCGP